MVSPSAAAGHFFDTVREDQRSPVFRGDAAVLASGAPLRYRRLQVENHARLQHGKEQRERERAPGIADESGAQLMTELLPWPEHQGLLGAVNGPLNLPCSEALKAPGLRLFALV